jgi:mRNA interferase YafQ
MKDLRTSKRFRRDLKRSIKRGYQRARLETVVTLLRQGQRLPQRFRDHGLSGEWQGSRECHVGPDWLLIYELTNDEVVLQRTGTHAELFQT